ncbi:glyoxalase [Pseudoroseomonas deserti]|uniref:Glyoxalase n=1 Tax=Teichococcus deserti TaxID=1817963 RepID=A0A1V2H2J0_9PROT|nr:VOC family protein [Pseudoroseomonas deserti]ONG53806.1 glyoxalase [Pseudoroseomonas deserti]
MLGYIMVGAADLDASGRFWRAVLAPLGYAAQQDGSAVVFSLPGAGDGVSGPPMLYVTRPFDGQAASHGNGSMVAFAAPSQAMVRQLHAAGLAAGGSDEGPPGFRDAYSDSFYVGYLRDPQRNKLALYCADPAQGRRGG